MTSTTTHPRRRATQMDILDVLKAAEGITATDLFAGGGGSSEGLRQAGLNVVLAANHNPLALATHQENHPETVHRNANLSEIDWCTFPSTDVAWVSPSCVWHAKSGGRKQPPAEVELLRQDQGAIDRATAFAAIAAAEVHKYPIMFVENVPEFRRWVLYPWWLDGLRGLGYQVEEMVLNAYDFGHAQHRPRLFVAATQPGIRLDLTLPPVERVNAASIIDPDPGEVLTRRLYVSGQIDSIREEGVLHLVTYRKNARARRADRYPVAAVTAGGNHHAIATILDGRPHYRPLTNREKARAQGFPDSYVFHGQVHDVRRQIGNAVPVGIARWLGTRAVEALIGEDVAA